jgi:hypothetical protein
MKSSITRKGTHLMQLTDEIIDLLPSQSLRRTIREGHFTFSQPDLLRIIFNHAETFDQRIAYMERFAEVADTEVADYTRKSIAWQKNILARFKEIQVGEVYELTIRCEGGWEEDFICSTYDAALRLIDLFYDEYGDVGASESVDTRYTLVKRRIYDGAPDRAYCEDQEAICVLGPGKRVLTVEDFIFSAPDDCDGVCLHCQKMCLFDDILFPRFWKHGDVVSYTDSKGVRQMGICLDSEKYDLLERVYVIPLNCEAFCYRDFENAHNYHDHIVPPVVDVVDISQLDSALADRVRAFRDSPYASIN